MFSIFKSRITVEQSATALSEVTQDIGTNYVQKVFSNAILPDIETVNEELFFLAMYIIDGLIKNPSEKSWMVNREPIAKQYYSRCAALAGQDIDTFMSLFLERMNFYNDGLSEHMAELAIMQNRDDRLVAVGSIVGELFADLCDVPEDNQHKLIGAGAFVAINLSTERPFSESKIIA